MAHASVHSLFWMDHGEAPPTPGVVSATWRPWVGVRPSGRTTGQVLHRVLTWWRRRLRPAVA